MLETAQADGESTTALALLPGGGFVLLDTVTTPELEAEGLARDVIRAVQDTRKAAGLDVSDRIRLDLAFAHDDDARALGLAQPTSTSPRRLLRSWSSSRPADDGLPRRPFDGGPVRRTRGAFTVGSDQTRTSTSGTRTGAR